MLDQNTIAYVLLLAIFAFVVRTELTDVHCPKLNGSTSKDCQEEGGMAYSGTRPTDSDSCKTLIEKIYKGAGAEQASIKWRRALILAMVITLLICVFLGSGLCRNNFNFVPDWRTFCIGVLIVFVPILFSFMYYSFHVFGVAESWMKGSIKQLEKKGCIIDK